MKAELISISKIKANPKLSRRWFEFDIGWMWFKALQKLKLAEIKQ